MVNIFLCVTLATQPAKMTRITFLLLAFVALVNSTGIGKHISIHTLKVQFIMISRLHLPCRPRNQATNQNCNQSWRLCLLQHQSKEWWHVSDLINNFKIIDIVIVASYPAKMKCQVTYKLGSGCKEMRFSCATMDLPNKDKKKCRKGDSLQVGKKK